MFAKTKKTTIICLCVVDCHPQHGIKVTATTTAIVIAVAIAITVVARKHKNI